MTFELKIIHDIHVFFDHRLGIYIRLFYPELKRRGKYKCPTMNYFLFQLNKYRKLYTHDTSFVILFSPYNLVMISYYSIVSKKKIIIPPSKNVCFILKYFLNIPRSTRNLKVPGVYIWWWQHTYDLIDHVALFSTKTIIETVGFIYLALERSNPLIFEARSLQNIDLLQKLNLPCW